MTVQMPGSLASGQVTSPPDLAVAHLVGDQDEVVPIELAADRPDEHAGDAQAGPRAPSCRRRACRSGTTDRWRCGAPAPRTRSGRPWLPTVSSTTDGEASPAGTIPDAPGSYQFKDAQGRVIYVGKAANLRQRLSNYFGDPAHMHPRTAQMVATAESVEWTTVRNEVEALMLEYSLIKEHDPASTSGSATTRATRSSP